MNEEWSWRTRAMLVLAGCIMGCIMLVLLMFFKQAPATISYTMLDGEPPVEEPSEPDCD